MEAQHCRRNAHADWRDGVNATVFVVCEGQTEGDFINQVVAPAFYPIGVSLIPQLIETSPGHKGGALNYSRVQKFVRNTLQRNRPVTTLFDLYGLPTNFPGYSVAKTQPLDQRLITLK